MKEHIQSPQQVQKGAKKKGDHLECSNGREANVANFNSEPKEALEMEINKVVSVRQGPQLHVPTRSLRCALNSTTYSEECEAMKTMTPNELLLALVNYFAPPMEVEETPPILERELSSMDSSYVTPNEEMSLENGVAYPSDLSGESLSQVQSLPMSTIANRHIGSLPNEVSSLPLSHSTQAGSAIAECTTSSTKYTPITLGGAIGIRRPRSSNSEAVNNNLTLDQLNPTLAEALAAMKAKSEATSKCPGNALFANGSDSYPSRRESLPTRMSGPVTLERSAVTSGHIVSFNGQTTEVPGEIYCHLCNYPMKLCLRKTKYKGEIREYAAYRCLRKGCQTFRSVRKVIEPDYPYPRKRKIEDPYEVFDNSSMGASSASANERANGNDIDTPTGTLIYVKQEVTEKQMEKMLEFDFKFFDEKPAPMFKAMERCEAMIRQEQSRTSCTSCDTQAPHAPAQVPASTHVLIPAEPPPKPLQTQSPLSYPASLPPHPLAPSSCSPSVHPSAPYSHNSQSIYDPTAMYEYPLCNTPTRLDSISNQNCGMASQIHSQDIRNQQCISEVIW
ncbi:unnamed protein product [Strongylus vulgaris]|uniref:Uncharacterized protein n=1 Tax=Strongylus vulgaris TaxID=40348 RepID=A0A3P7JEQ8_STRVU|nr:unnamed protein product [Strongylus vulgaris]